MSQALLVRFRPDGPWRIGPDSGARNRVDHIFHSDALFSAVSHAMLRLGRLDEWLSATATAFIEPAVRLSSLFPFQDKLQFVPPPRSLWPPAPSPRVRWQSARFVPLSLVRELVAEKPLHDNRWFLDGASGCLLPADAQYHSGPFRVALRSHAAVDRPTGAAVEVHRTACLEFAEGAGLWGVASFSGEFARSRWSGPLEAAFRLLADTGLGGERSLGWGRSQQPEFITGELPDLILPAQPPPPPPEAVAEGEPEPAPKAKVETGYWLLSMFSPAESDAVDWRRGAYALAERGGRIDSPARAGEAKKLVRMVEEGSVLFSASALRGAAPDVAPDGFPHPVFRYGFALAVPIPVRGAQ